MNCCFWRKPFKENKESVEEELCTKMLLAGKTREELFQLYILYKGLEENAAVSEVESEILGSTFSFAVGSFIVAVLSLIFSLYKDENVDCFVLTILGIFIFLTAVLLYKCFKAKSTKETKINTLIMTYKTKQNILKNQIYFLENLNYNGIEAKIEELIEAAIKKRKTI